MSEERHGVAVKRPFVRCMVTEEDIIDGQMVYERSLRERQRWLEKVF